MRFRASARTPDGILIFDTCPSKAAFDEFASSPEGRELYERHDLGDPVAQVDFPVVRAYAGGVRIDVPD